MSEPVEHDGRHFFIVLEHLGVEADRLGIRAVDAYDEAGSVSDFLDKVIRYILAREKECDRSRLTDEEREAIKEACDEGRWYPKDYHHISAMRALLERAK